MKPITKIIAQGFLLSFIFAVTACNNANESTKTEEHFLTEKLDTIKKAEAVDQLIQNAGAVQRRTINEQGQ